MSISVRKIGPSALKHRLYGINAVNDDNKMLEYIWLTWFKGGKSTFGELGLQKLLTGLGC